MARFSLSSHPWELIFMYRVHNSTVSRQLRYALTKERLCCMAVTPATYAPYAEAEMGGGCMHSRGMWGWCLVCCGKIQYKGKYNWKFICNILSILREGDRRTGNLPPAEVFPKERLAQRLRYCRIMPMKRRNAPAWMPGQGETAPWTARFDGFVKHRKSKKHNSYSTLAA